MAMAISLSGGASFAQTQPDSTDLPRVLVSATGAQQPLADVLSSVSVITRADILRSQAQSLADLLQGEAGFEFARNGGPGAVTSFFLRGQDSINTAIVVDGVRAPVDQIGSLLVIDIPLQQIERIEILRGNASALYGDAAVGGVISITTVSGTGAAQASGAVTLGARNTRELQAGYAAEIDAQLAARASAFVDHCLAIDDGEHAILGPGPRALIAAAAFCMRGEVDLVAEHLRRAYDYGMTRRQALDAICCVVPMSGMASATLGLRAMRALDATPAVSPRP